MKHERAMALILAITMVAGSRMAVFAEDDDLATQVEGQGSILNYVNTDIIGVTLPTQQAVANVFDYYVDPEGAIKSAGELADGTAVTGNDDGVYFKNVGTDARQGTLSWAIAADPSGEYQISGVDLTTNQTYTYVDTPEQNGSVTEYTINSRSTGYKVEVDALNVNATYSYNGSEWKKDGSAASINVTITTDPEDSSYTPQSGDTFTVSGYEAAVQEWQDESNSTASDITVMDSDGMTPGTIAGGDTITVTDAVAAGAVSYSSSSDAVKFEGKNSVDVDVTVTVTVTATDAEKDIDLVADQAALDAAEGPALLLILKVGSDSKAITSAGTSATATIAGVPGNFEVKPAAGGTQYGFVIKESDLSAWNSITVQLVGKTNKKEVPEGAGAMTVPKITLTWSMAKAAAPTYTEETAYGDWSDALWLGKDVSTGFSTTGATKVEASGDGISYDDLTTNQYTLDDSGWMNISCNNLVAGIGSEPSSPHHLINHW